MELKRVQRILEFRQLTRLNVREAELQREIDDLLKHEENIWCQKSQLSDLRIEIGILSTSIGGWCFDYEILQQHFFQELYTAGIRVTGSFPCRSIFPIISEYDRELLLMVPTDEEIRRAMFSMLGFMQNSTSHIEKLLGSLFVR
ncbi:hypothetical protein ES332_D11G235000v1 [Gossypium tomentosum]|uniref:Uncharacterized protein n=1 Tax=Gossypium tomentosum TaxID=34277 RepID=A0A5D2IR45_GOSTO|nr:hypothetical protein ES332_D11G235000v1 [Gossypium tomentosum]